MILDERNEFCDATALTAAAAGTALEGDVIDTGGDGAEGNSDDLYLVIQITTAVVGPDTVQFKLASDAAAAIATDGTATVHFETPAIAVASLVAGYQVCAVKLPSGTYERYLGILRTTVGAGALSAGAINAFLTPNAPARQSFPDGL